MHHLHDPPSDALLRFAHSCSFAALSRRPSLRSARGCATRQASPAVSLSLKRQASPAARTLSQLSSPISPGGTINLTESRWGRSQKKTQGTDGRNDRVLWDHALRMCAWLGKPDCSRQRPAD